MRKMSARKAREELKAGKARKKMKVRAKQRKKACKHIRHVSM